MCFVVLLTLPPVQADNLNAIITASGNEVQPYWGNLISSFVEGKDLDEFLLKPGKFFSQLCACLFRGCKPTRVEVIFLADVYGFQQTCRCKLHFLYIFLYIMCFFPFQAWVAVPPLLLLAAMPQLLLSRRRKRRRRRKRMSAELVTSSAGMTRMTGKQIDFCEH